MIIIELHLHSKNVQQFYRDDNKLSARGYAFYSRYKNIEPLLLFQVLQTTLPLNSSMPPAQQYVEL